MFNSITLNNSLHSFITTETSLGSKTQGCFSFFGKAVTKITLTKSLFIFSFVFKHLIYPGGFTATINPPFRCFKPN